MKEKFIFSLLIVSLFIAPSFSYAQEQKEDSINAKRLAFSIGLKSSIYVGGMLYLSEVWYRDRPRVPLHFYDDNAGWNQMDKWGHAYIAYHQSRASYHLQRWSGVPKSKAIWFGGSLGFFFQLPIEIFDGLHEGYGFSWGDVGANAFGTILFMTQEWFFDSQPVKMKFSFYPSNYSSIRPRVLGQNPLENLFMDYNAQTYWLSTNLNHIWRADYIPDWLSIAFGYSGGGMLAEFDNPRFILGNNVEHIKRYRQFFLSPDIDFTKLPLKKNKFFKTITESFNLLKMPAPAIEYNTEYGWIFHFIYF